MQSASLSRPPSPSSSWMATVNSPKVRLCTSTLFPVRFQRTEIRSSAVGLHQNQNITCKLMQLHMAYKKLDKPWRNKCIVLLTLACQCRRQTEEKSHLQTLETLQSLFYRPWFLTFSCPCFCVKRSPLHFCRSIERRLGGEDKGHAPRVFRNSTHSWRSHVNKGRVGVQMRILGRHRQATLRIAGKHVLDGSCICYVRLVAVMVANLLAAKMFRLGTRFALLVS